MDSDTSDYIESDNEYEFCCGDQCQLRDSPLPFDYTSIEKIILTISDKFNFRVVLNDERAKNALLVTTGLAVAGCIIGKHYGGKIGSAVGGAIGGICGVGVVAVSMRDLWEDVKPKLLEMFDIVYDYLAGLGLNDYANAANYLTTHSGHCAQLAMIIVQTISDILGQKVFSSLTATTLA